jgi:crossover junction endodeoxyribonuclease RusA
MNKAEFDLPWPPSLNGYWRRVGNRTLISAAGRSYREHVVLLIRMAKLTPFTGPIRYEAVYHQPDKRRRDLDNLIKVILDSLQHAGLYADDSQVHQIDIRFGCQVDGGRVNVLIRDC